jgi:hypothetical protein
MSVTVTFVRHRERRDRIYAVRDDGTATSWDFPSYGDRLPHDLCHLVVEEGLGIADGFWGMVDRGVAVALVDDQATLVHDGRPLAEQPGVDFSGLIRSEEAVALFGSTGSLGRETGFTLPRGVSEAEIASIGRRLHDLARQWHELGDGGSITLVFATTR